MKCLDITILESDSDCSFDNTDSTFQYLFSGHDYLAFPCSLPYFEIFKIEQLTILVCMDEDEWLTLMQEHIRYFVAFLEFYGFDSSSSLSHRSEVAAFEEQHPSVLRHYTYIVGIIHCFYTQYLFLVSEFHDDGRELLE